jgi:HlyD family secretion protein
MGLRTQWSARRAGAVLAGAAVAGWLVSMAYGRVVPRVRVVYPRRAEIVRTVVASGRVLAPTRASLGASVTSTVRKVAVREGDRVQTGDVLVELDARELEAAVAQARARVRQATVRGRQIAKVLHPVAREEVAQAQASLELAEGEWKRAQVLFAQGVISPATRDQALQAFVSARSRLRSLQQQSEATGSGGVEREQASAARLEAEAALAVAEARLQYARIVAPSEGVILFRDVQVGDVVQPSKPLLIFEPTGQTTLVVDFDEKDLAEIRVGQPAVASADAYASDRFDATVTYIAPRVDPKRATIEIRLNVTRPPTYLKPDMTVSVEVQVGRKSEAMVVPMTVVRDTSASSAWVMVVRRHRTERQNVTLGLLSSERAEVLAGVQPNEALVPIAEGVSLGRRVRVAPQKGP